MKTLKNHIILSLIAIFATNTFFLFSWISDFYTTSGSIINGLSFLQFLGIVNGALVMIALFSLTYKKLGDDLLSWGYSNAFRFVLLIILSLFVFITAYVLLLFVHFILRENSDPILAVSEVFKSSYFHSLIFYFSLVSILMFFISNLERRSGNITLLIAQSMGEIVKPKSVDKGFMFIDLNDATSLAENLGSHKYAELLRLCFKMLSDLVAHTPFQIYQYVGDEAVICWNAEESKGDLTSLQLFTDFKAYLQERNNFFQSAFGINPIFKCAIHSGEVIQSEIGRNVKHLVYHGDVLNTTSRLLDSCHFYRTDLIISKSAIKNPELISRTFSLYPLKEKYLKGKSKLVEAYKATLNTELLDDNKNLKTMNFFTPKTTISQLNKL